MNTITSDSEVQISVVIPVHWSSATLQELLQRSPAVLDGSGASYEVVFVDDGSPDTDSSRVGAWMGHSPVLTWLSLAGLLPSIAPLRFTRHRNHGTRRAGKTERFTKPHKTGLRNST